ncbi:hypothetical protein MPH_05734 [Macrophomina phaseolina MS6]|uniref:Uncharacterized protein n=2 Tax=Macrophomina phaseolina TaxID=35725 RepID=K2S3K0_MACPH|nr:hypothetical protein MPH_05734 [Macrophomina phaseolina MS6]KAH7049252.1 hypothetical protein B0J12DRAFT_740745 [Macrophomina phaseolina]
MQLSAIIFLFFTNSLTLAAPLTPTQSRDALSSLTSITGSGNASDKIADAPSSDNAISSASTARIVARGFGTGVAQNTVAGLNGLMMDGFHKLFADLLGENDEGGQKNGAD